MREEILEFLALDTDEAVDDRAGAALGEQAGEFEGHHGAGMKAGQQHAVQPERRDDAFDDPRELRDVRMFVEQRIGQAVSRHVDSDDREVLREALDVRRHLGR